MKRILALLLLAVATACAQLPGAYRTDYSLDEPKARLAVTANPMASRAAMEMLDIGGSPIDAAIAAQMMLGLVEPQSSGLGGGTLVMLWDAPTGRLHAYDGLAAAPAHVTASLRTDTDGRILPGEPSRRGGRSVGVPGTLQVLAKVHAKFGRVAWKQLFEPAIVAAEKGFPISPYLHGILAQPGAAKSHPDMAALYFDAQGQALPVGTMVRNPEYARTLRAIATQGAEGWLRAEGAREIATASKRGFRPTLMTEQDVLDYRAVERDPVCAVFLAYRVCTAPPPSFGGITVLQILQMVQDRAGGRYDFADPAFAHLYAEAGRLAQADRRQYVGDPDFVAVPVAGLVDAGYVRSRAALIDPAHAAKNPKAGTPPAKVAALAPDAGDPQSMTSQITIADAKGSVVSITTTINLNFGSRLMAGGFVLNDVLTNFSAAPRPGERLANQMEPRKRPATSMAPTIVFDAAGQAVVAGGAAGGGPIVDYVASALIDLLANGATPGEALSHGHLSTAIPGKVTLEKGTAAAALAPGLRERGQAVEEGTLLSGLGFIRRLPGGWIGAADPRRDGVPAGH